MEVLNELQITSVGGGKPRPLNVVGGALFGGVIGGLAGLFVGGPPGFFIGFFHGAIEGVGTSLIYEAGTELSKSNSVVEVKK